MLSNDVPFTGEPWSGQGPSFHYLQEEMGSDSIYYQYIVPIYPKRKVGPNRFNRPSVVLVNPTRLIGQPEVQ